MKRAVCLPLVLALAATSVQAELEPILINLSSDNTTNISYTIPASKVLLVEHVQVISPTNALNPPLISASCGPDGFTVLPVQWSDENRWVIPVTGSYVAFITLERTLKFPAGCTLSVFPPGGAGGNGALLMGMLADTADLFAAVGSEIERVAETSDTMDMLVRLHSPRPVRLQTESFTTKTGAWNPRADAIVAATDDATLKNVSLAADGEFELFRFKARKR